MNNSAQFRKISMLLVATMFITSIAVGAAITASCANFNTTLNSGKIDNLPPQIITNPNNETTCQGGSVSFTVVASGTNITYQWKKGNTNLMNGGNISGATSATLTINPATSSDAASNYWVLVSGPYGNPVGSDYVSLLIANAPSPTITGPAQICPGTSGTLDAGSYSSYHWSTGSMSETINVNTSGTYMVTVTNSSGCTSAGQKAISLYSAVTPQILSTGLNQICGGGSGTLWVGSNYPSYNWSTGDRTQTISINSGGTYMVTVTNNNGCSGMASLAVNNVTCTTPGSLTTTNMGSTYATANWQQPGCYYDYTIGISPHNMNTWTEYTFNPNSHYTFSGLSRSTIYDWHIRTNCNSTQTETSDWTSTMVFTTSSARESENPSTNSYPFTFNVYPNPANDQVNIVFSADYAGAYILNLTDMTGRLVKTEIDNAGLGDNTQVFNLNGVAKGIYLLEFKMGDIVNQTKIFVE